MHVVAVTADLTGLPIANASLLDEGTAAAEAMQMLYRVSRKKGAHTFFVSEECHPQTIEVVRARAVPLEIEVVVGDHRSFAFTDEVFGALVQYPASDGAVYDYAGFCEAAHEADAFVPLSREDLRRKIFAIFKHQSQKDTAPFPGGHDEREFWQRVEDRNRDTAVRLDRLGLPEFHAAEAFVVVPGEE